MSNAIGGVNAAQTDWSQLAAQRQKPQLTLKPVADLLGTTPDDLIKQLKSGATLSDIATTQGVSRTDLLTAIQQGLQSSTPQGGDPADLATVAANVADGKVKLGGHHHHHHSAGGNSPTSASGVASGGASSGTAATPFANLASALGMDQSGLLQALNAGTSLADLASSKGIATSDLQSMLAADHQVDTTA